MKLGRQGQHLTCILAPDSPLHETPILAKLNNVSQPLSAGRARDHDDVGHITRPDTTANGQLNSLQQSTFPPFSLQPFHRNFGQTPLDIAATASTNRDLPDHQALRFQRTIWISVHSIHSA
jgi:hypothetical protein